MVEIRCVCWAQANQLTHFGVVDFDNMTVSLRKAATAAGVE
jgi:hypothetical protein